MDSYYPMISLNIVIRKECRGKPVSPITPNAAPPTLSLPRFVRNG